MLTYQRSQLLDQISNRNQSLTRLQNPILGDRYENMLVRLKERIDQVQQISLIDKAHARSLSNVEQLESEVKAAAANDGLKLDPTALKKPDYFAPHRPQATKRLRSDYHAQNKQKLREFFRKKQLVQPYPHAELALLPMEILEEQSKVQFNVEKLEPKLREDYLRFVATKVNVPIG